MGKRLTSERHKPSFKSYLWHNLKTTFAIAEKAELMAALGYILVSAFLGIVAGLSASQISAALAEWNLRAAIGLVVFLVILFGVITPFRMWRKSVWVANVEKALEELYEYHDKGVDLLNAHYEAVILNPKLESDPLLKYEYVNKWNIDYFQWSSDVMKKIKVLYPLEAMRFKNVVCLY